MSNLYSVKSAIKAELDNAQRGLSFYQLRVEVLAKTLDELDTVSLEDELLEEAPKQRTGRRGRPAGAAQARGRRPAGANKKTLPTTGAEFWLALISGEPQSGAEVLKQAVANLGFEADKTQVQKLRQRVAPALKALLDAGKIQDSGSGRNRRYIRV